MTYDEDLANRLRELLADEAGVTEKKMFGGLAFLLHGHMSVSASGQGGILARIDPAETDAALNKPHVALMEMRGRTMEGWLRVAPEGARTKRQLAPWVKRSVAYVKTLPPKEGGPPTRSGPAARGATGPPVRLARRAGGYRWPAPSSLPPPLS